MPEGHALHRLARDLNEVFGGKRVRSSSPQGRFVDANDLDGRILRRAETWGKHLFVAFSGTDQQVHVHLGLYGSLRFASANAPIVGEVRWRLSHRTATADLRGPTACELLDPHARDLLLARLGPDPLRSDADPTAFIDAVLKSRSSIANLLMDQKVVSGVGNIFRAEVLFREQVDPFVRGCDLDEGVVERLWNDLVVLMHVGLERGRIDTVRAEHEPGAMGRPPREDDHGGEVYVYRRESQPCWVCASPIVTRKFHGRNLFWCPSCQVRR